MNLQGSSTVAQLSTSVSVLNRRVVRGKSPENKGKIQRNVQTFDKYKRPGSNNNNDKESSRAVNKRDRKQPLSSSESTQVISEGNNIVSSRRPIQVRISNHQKNHSPSALQMITLPAMSWTIVSWQMMFMMQHRRKRKYFCCCYEDTSMKGKLDN